jgi:hypothetical protein
MAGPLHAAAQGPNERAATVAATYFEVMTSRQDMAPSRVTFIAT